MTQYWPGEDGRAARVAYARLVEQAYGWPARKVYGQGRVWRRAAHRCPVRQTWSWPSSEDVVDWGTRAGLVLVCVGLPIVGVLDWYGYGILWPPRPTPEERVTQRTSHAPEPTMVMPNTSQTLTNKHITTSAVLDNGAFAVATQPEFDTQVESWSGTDVNLPLLAASRPGDEPSASYEGSPGQESLVFDAQVQECVVWRLDSRHRVKPRALTLWFTMEQATAGTAAMSVALNGYAPHPAEAPVRPTLGFVQKMTIPLPTDGLGLRPAHVPVTRVQLCRHITADTAVGALAVHRVRLEP